MRRFHYHCVRKAVGRQGRICRSGQIRFENRGHSSKSALPGTYCLWRRKTLFLISLPVNSADHYYNLAFNQQSNQHSSSTVTVTERVLAEENCPNFLLMDMQSSHSEASDVSILVVRCRVQLDLNVQIPSQFLHSPSVIFQTRTEDLIPASGYFESNR
jgi:hypothetical protein